MVAIVAALAAAWVAVILLAPWLPVPVAGVVYLLGGRLCHQIAERSFHLDGAQLPVCARCLGVYVGAVVGFTYACGASLTPGSPSRLRDGVASSPGVNPRGSRHRDVLLGALALNGVTMILESTGVWAASNAVRATVGAVLGVAVALAIGTVDYEQWPSPRRITSALPDSHI